MKRLIFLMSLAVSSSLIFAHIGIGKTSFGDSRNRIKVAKKHKIRTKPKIRIALSKGLDDKYAKF